jgi:hypothetical protein
MTMKNETMRLLVSRSSRLALTAAAGALLLAAPLRAQKAFDSPQQAADALVAAAAAGDNAALITIFGPDGKDLVTSGDAVEDKNRLAKFSELAKQKTHIATDAKKPNTATIEVGPDDWPLPIPLARKDGKWRFDTKAGRHEVLARRIGGNELAAINLLRGYVEAQEEYASAARDGNPRPQYAEKWISTPGRQDGLSWKNADGTPGGPIGDVVAKALAAGYSSKAEPYNGYYFRTLTKQGPDARLGERDYVVNGRLIGGFAAIAWPANYGVTGIMTFIVNNDGVVYQKDLGPDTAKAAAAIDSFNPDKTWEITDDEE